MNNLSVRFCMGCGQVLDEIHPSGGQPCWIAAHIFRAQYGFGLDELHLIEDACPPCARVFAIALRGVSPEAAEPATKP